MTKNRILIFNGMILAFDVLFICVAFIIASYIKVGRIEDPIAVAIANSRLLVFASFVLATIFNYFGLYSQVKKRAEVDEAAAVFGALTVGMLFFEFMTLFYRDLIFKRMTIFYAWAISFFLIAGFRLTSIIVMKNFFKKGLWAARVLIIGTGDNAKMLFHRIMKHPEYGMRVAGLISTDGEPDAAQGPVLGTSADLKEIMKKHRINKVIFAIPEAPTAQLMGLIEMCETEQVEFMFVPRVLDIIESRISTEDIMGIPLVSVKEIQLHGLNAALKRAFDVLSSSLLLLLLLPLFAAVALLIKMTSRGPVLYVQRRVGYRGRQFDMYKFRSMVAGADKKLDELKEMNEADGPIFKIKNDPRITMVGRLIRKWSIDELPQLINVLKGDMSIVGPRPPLPSETALYGPWHRKRLNVAPGITGLWQVSGRSDLSFDDMVKLDLFYIESWSLWLDIKIIIKTLPVVVIARGAY